MIKDTRGEGIKLRPSAPSFLKRIAFVTITFLLLLCALELLSSAFLYRYYAATEQPFVPRGSSSIYLIKKAFKIPIVYSVQSVDPQPLYILDQRLGYTTHRGRYKVAFTAAGKTYRFNFTAPQDGVRLTNHFRKNSDRSIYVFGDSIILGWGNNDEQTMPWLLQGKFPDYNVINLAQNGYGNTHSVIQYKMIENNVGSNDVVILGYGEFYLIRNYGAPSFVRMISRGVEQRLADPEGFADVRYPVARLGPNGELTIDYIKLLCKKNAGYCDGKDPDYSSMVEATKPILQFFSTVKAKVILAYISGPDNDPVIKYAREIGLPVADIRIDKRSPEWSDFGEFDSHPSQVAQYNYYQKLAAALIEQKILTDLRK